MERCGTRVSGLVLMLLVLVAWSPPGGWFPEERIGVEEALRAYTVNNAFAGYEEDDKGTLEPGKLADITVLDRNLLAIPADEIKDVQVLYTIVDGRAVFSKETQD